MLNLGFGEMVMIAILAIVFVGPERLPTMLRTMGRMYGKLRAQSEELRRAFVMEADRIEAEERSAEVKARQEEARQRIAAKKLAAANGMADPDEPVARTSPAPTAPSIAAADPTTAPTAPDASTPSAATPPSDPAVPPAPTEPS